MTAAASETPVERWLKAPRLAQDRERFLGPLMDINVAHVVMLREQELLAPESAAALLQAIARVRQDPARVTAHSDREDLYFAVEAAITDLAGEDAGGQMHIGRSRNDIAATMTRMVVREEAERVQGLLLGLIGTLLTLAAGHARTVMPGYTHLRPAQPTTLGHYLTGLAWALRRDFCRLADARRRANESPMGAAAFAGTGFAVDRIRVAALLGFARPVAHTQDAVASRDTVLELLAGFALLAATVARLLEDLYVWSTLEFGFVTLDPTITGGSSIMPQKQNPNVLERTRAKAAHAAAALFDALTATKGTGFMHCQDISVESVAPFWQAVQEVAVMLEVTGQVVRTMRVNVARLRERATAGFTMATEVADGLVRTRGIPFRTAHGIVARAGRDVSEDDLAGLVTRLNAHGAEVGRSLHLTADEVRAWMDPDAALARRRAGGPAPEGVARQVDELSAWARGAAEELDRDRRDQAAAAAAREEAARRIIARS